MGNALQARDVVKYYGDKCVCRSINLSVPEGVVYGLLGRNGAGKSTLLKIAMGLVRPDRGRVDVLGHDAWNLDPQVKARIAFTAEGHPLPRWMSVNELVQFTASFYTRWQPETANQLLSHFRLPRASSVKALSNGQRAQLSLTIALAIDPDLLVLDDPTLGLDPVVRRDVLDAIVRFVQRPGRTVIISTHQMSDVERIADRVGVVVDGVLRVDAPVDRFREAIKRIVVSFDGEPPRFPAFDGLVDVRRERNTLTAIVVDWDERKRRMVAALDPQMVEAFDLSMEDAFVEYTRGSGANFPDLVKEPADEPLVRSEGAGL
jgi:ABC-2 type transport system ATP-binding protein